MRRRLTVMSLAVTLMVALSFLIPLGLLVKDLAHDRALGAAERDAESVARFLAVVGPERGVMPALASWPGSHEGEHALSIVLTDGHVAGDPLQPDERVDQALSGTSVRIPLTDGEAIHIPVVLEDGSIVVVRTFVENELLMAGVASSWLTLGALGVVLVVIAAFVSDRMARSIAHPVEELSETAASLARGDLHARVDPSGPREIYQVGAEFNRLAEQITSLLKQEREAAADLSHRLRTPLMAVRLDAEALPDSGLRSRLLEDIDDLARHVDFVIREARRDLRSDGHDQCDLTAVLAERVEFWAVLADEQGRTVDFSVHKAPVPVALDEAGAAAMIDALIGNVFAHTAEGVSFAVRLEVVEGAPLLTVEDAGPGFMDASVLERGESRGRGTGLGLDIARMTVETVGGSFELGRSESLGGARIRLVFPVLSEVSS